MSWENRNKVSMKKKKRKRAKARTAARFYSSRDGADAWGTHQSRHQGSTRPVAAEVSRGVVSNPEPRDARTINFRFHPTRYVSLVGHENPSTKLSSAPSPKFQRLPNIDNRSEFDRKQAQWYEALARFEHDNVQDINADVELQSRRSSTTRSSSTTVSIHRRDADERRDDERSD